MWRKSPFEAPQHRKSTTLKAFIVLNLTPFKVTCLIDSLSSSICAPTNNSCLCIDQNYTEIVSQCVMASCSVKDQLRKSALDSTSDVKIQNHGVAEDELSQEHNERHPLTAALHTMIPATTSSSHMPYSLPSTRLSSSCGWRPGRHDLRLGDGMIPP